MLIKRKTFYRFNIDIAGFSADGDQRLLSAMRSQMQFDEQYMLGDIRTLKCFTQDTIHTVLKFRNRLLKASILMPMGYKQVTVTHLKLLINSAGKDVHGLVLKDICPDDKQNFRSLKNVINPRVLDALILNVPDSQATVMYLKLCSNIESAMNDFDMMPVERIKRIWFTVFFLRIWRKWILSSKYSLTQNWITPNAYACVEVNAHSIVRLMRIFRQNNEDHLFLLFMFNSQTCEQAFRQFRSMTTLNWTRINFTVLELTHMISRLELQNEIVHFKLADIGIEFPRIANKKEKFKFYPLPSDQEIDNAIKDAKNDALHEALKFGIEMHANKITKCELPNINVDFDEFDSYESFSESDEFNFEMDQTDPFNFDEEDTVLSGILEQKLCLNEYSGDDLNIDEKSRFTKITDENGDTKIVRKSSLVWLLSNSNKEKLSNDRLHRVQNKPGNGHRQLNSKSKIPTYGTGRLLYISDELCLGEWAFFENPIVTKRSKKNYGIENYLVGAVMGFIHSNGKTAIERQYSWNFASVSKENIQVMATWYHLQSNGEFTAINENNSFYIPIKNYLITMQSPCFESDKSSGVCRKYLPTASNTKIRQDFEKIMKNRKK